MTADAPIITGQQVSATMWQTAKQLRRRMTRDERVLWEHLRAGRFHRLHFRRQQIIGPYVVDFYCHAAMLVVELDGETHRHMVERDRERDAMLASRGMQVLRFKNAQVRDNPASVLTQIADACCARIDQSQ